MSNEPNQWRERPDMPDEPVYSEAQPMQGQPEMVRLSLPLFGAWAWKVLLGLIIAVYVVEVIVAKNLTPDNLTVYYLGAKWNPAIYSGEYWRLISAMFLHASLLHIMFNGYSLFAVGPAVERFFGTARFLAIYFITGLAGSVASYAFSPNLSVGASGAIFGLVGALAGFFYVSRETLGEMAKQQLGSLVTVIMLNLFIGLSGGGIDNYAHVGGLVCGGLLGVLLAPRYAIDDRTYPPVVVRRFLPFGWPGALAVALLLAALVVFAINPPILVAP